MGLNMASRWLSLGLWGKLGLSRGHFGTSSGPTWGYFRRFWCRHALQKQTYHLSLGFLMISRYLSSYVWVMLVLSWPNLGPPWTILWLCRAILGPSWAPTRFDIVPTWSPDGQDGPKMAQDDLKMVQRRAKRASRWPQDGSA